MTKKVETINFHYLSKARRHALVSEGYFRQWSISNWLDKIKSKCKVQGKLEQISLQI